MRYIGSIVIMLLALSGCNRNNSLEALPTLAEPNAIATGLVLTEKAPPQGFDTVSFPHIDDNLEALSGWRYEMVFGFNGVYSRTSREATSSTKATVTYNQLGSARRVVATIDDDLEEASDPTVFEGVRLGPDAFLLRDSICLPNADADAQLLADLNAGELLGGVQQASVAPHIERINGEEVWQYNLNFDQIIVPNVTLTEESRVLEMRGELWVAPKYNAVVRYYINLQVENVLILGQTLPVTGEIIIRYDLYDIGIVPNISVPFGC